MSGTPQPLRAIVVSQDVHLLHEISWMLEAVGYGVETSNDLDGNALWRRYSSADFVILDGRGIADPQAATFAFDAERVQYRIVLYDATRPVDFAAWYAVGAHDAIHTPVSRGEILARLRTGARYLEFERRLEAQSFRSAVPGMVSRRGLLCKLRKRMASDDFASQQHVLLVCQIDWYDGIRRRGGESVGVNLVNTAARTVKKAVGENAIAACFGDGRFAALLTNQSAAAAKSIAESLAKDFCSRESHHESIPRPTLSTAIVPWTAGTTAERLLEESLDTLALAAHSGGDCVLVHGEFATELTAWEEEMSSGNSFASVTVQDIMDPFPALLERGAENREIVAALRRSSVPVRPYVDADGRLLGVAADDDGEIPADGEPLVQPETIAFDASFPEIYEAFSTSGCSTLVVTADDRPLGYLTCDSFLSMIDPIDTDTFAQTDKSVDELAYLRVPPLAGNVEVEAAAV